MLSFKEKRAIQKDIKSNYELLEAEKGFKAKRELQKAIKELYAKLSGTAPVEASEVASSGHKYGMQFRPYNADPALSDVERVNLILAEDMSAEDKAKYGDSAKHGILVTKEKLSEDFVTTHQLTDLDAPTDNSFLDKGDELDTKLGFWSKVVNNTFPKDAMGLTSEDVRDTERYKEAKKNSEYYFKLLRNYNDKNKENIKKYNKE